MPLTFLPLALDSGTVFLVFLGIFTLAVAFGLYTRGGSGISQRPSGQDKSTIKGDEGEGGNFGGAGTR